MAENMSGTAGIHSLPELLTAQQAADVMHISKRTVERMCEGGELKAVRVRKLWRVNRDSLAAFLGI